ncbi:hypothetical protein ACL02S_08735 [Nocardia sp. 004]|uniref:hypothetical protein n=1 Tax=Nocardia sp. 004 TaxID=3385978 RepID=UPI0039A2F8A0
MAISETNHGVTLAIDIPRGYVALPLEGVDDSIQRAAVFLAEVASDDIQEASSDVLQKMGFLLTQLAARNVVYCGLGRHFSEDREPVTSALVIHLNTLGDQRNPRLVLGEALTAKRNAGEVFSNVELVDIAGRPSLILDRVRVLPIPEISGREPDTPESSIYQIEAIVSAPDGSAIAAIDFSTPFIEHGEEYLPMVVGMIGSIEFVSEFRPETSSLDL